MLRAPIPPGRRWRLRPPLVLPKVPECQLLARFTAFFQGDWGNLIRAAVEEACTTLIGMSPSDDVAKRAERTAHLARLGNCPKQGKPRPLP